MKRKSKPSCSLATNDDKEDDSIEVTGSVNASQSNIDSDEEVRMCSVCGRDDRDGGKWKQTTDIEKGWIEFIKNHSNSKMSNKVRSIGSNDWIHIYGQRKKRCHSIF